MDKLIEEADNNRVDLMGLLDVYGMAWNEYKRNNKEDCWDFRRELRCSNYAFAKARRYIYDTKSFIDYQNGVPKEGINE